eukprot:gene12636-biopygen11012
MAGRAPGDGGPRSRGWRAALPGIEIARIPGCPAAPPRLHTVPRTLIDPAPPPRPQGSCGVLGPPLTGRSVAEDEGREATDGAMMGRQRQGNAVQATEHSTPARLNVFVTANSGRNGAQRHATVVATEYR